MELNSFVYENTKSVILKITFIWLNCLETIITLPRTETVDHTPDISTQYLPTVNDPTFRFLSPESFPPRLITAQQIEKIL